MNKKQTFARQVFEMIKPHLLKLFIAGMLIGAIVAHNQN